MLKTTHSKQKITVLTLCTVILWALAIVGCKTIVGARSVEKYNQNPLTVLIPQNLSPEAIEGAMVQTLTGRGWRVEQRSPEEVVGQLNRRAWEAKAILKVDVSLIKILNDSYYKSDNSGERKPAIPKGWLENLQKDLQTHLGKTR